MPGRFLGAIRSPLNDLRGHLILSHVRRATVSGVELTDTQPFVRELVQLRLCLLRTPELAGRLRLRAHEETASTLPCARSRRPGATCRLVPLLEQAAKAAKPGLASRPARTERRRFNMIG